MGVATHLGIDLAEYDSRIRTFIPNYEEMLSVGAIAVPATATRIVDLGIGTGAFSQKCRHRAAHAEVVGIDADPEILKAAAHRLGSSAQFICASFEDAVLPACEVAISSFALHHIRTQQEKTSIYARLQQCLASGGKFVLVDCCPAQDQATATEQMLLWKKHLMQSYSEEQADEYLQDWAKEDVYQPLTVELTLLREVGFAPEILWRKGAFAVVLALKH